MSVVTHGLGDASGLIVTHGLGSYIVAPTFIPTKLISADIQHLINQMQQLTKCKQSTGLLAMKLAVRGSDLDTLDLEGQDIYFHYSQVQGSGVG